MIVFYGGSDDSGAFLYNIMGMSWILYTFSAHINYGSCRWISSRYGVNVQCESGRVATGSCGSGKDANCGTHVWNRIRCCETGKRFTGVATVRWGDFGAEVVCPSGQIMTEFCGSASRADCLYRGRKRCTVIRCQGELIIFWF